MPTKKLATKVWIEEGCIVCDACETAAPTVFEVTEDTCIIRPSALNAEFTKPLTEEIIDAAEECPVDVIKFDLAPFEVSEAEAAVAEVAEAAPAESAAEATAVASPLVGGGGSLPTRGDATEPATAVGGRSSPPRGDATEPATAVGGGRAAPTKGDATEPALAAGTKNPATTSAGDPAMQALLKAAKTRGGEAGIAKSSGGAGVTRAIDRKNPDDLPADARYAKTLEAAKKGKNDPSRRGVVTGSAVALTVGWGSFGVANAIAWGPAMVRFLMPNALEEPDPQVRVGSVKNYLEMAPGAVNEDYKPKGIWMIREEDRIAALNIICTHLGCIPNWLPNDRKFLCPCHGSGYYYTGVNFQGPTPRPLERFKISVVDGIVVVDKSKKFQQELGQWDNVESYLSV